MTKFYPPSLTHHKHGHKHRRTTIQILQKSQAYLLCNVSTFSYGEEVTPLKMVQFNVVCWVAEVKMSTVMEDKFYKCEDNDIPSGRKCWNCPCCKDTTDLKEIDFQLDRLKESVRKALQNKE